MWKEILKWLIYSAVVYVCLIPLQLWVISIGISLVGGLIAGLLNEIRRELLIMNLRNKEDKPDELIKS